MADRHIVANDRGANASGRVDHGEVLDIGPRTYDDVLDVAAKDRVVPNGRLVREVNSADDVSTGRDEDILAEFGPDASKGGDISLHLLLRRVFRTYQVC